MPVRTMATKRETKEERVKRIARRIVGTVPSRKVFTPKPERKPKHKEEFE
jgi:hypothetical protein